MIKVIIERKIIEGFESHFDQLVRKTLTVALQAPGYISSEVLVCYDQDNHRIVATNWSSFYHWQQWQLSADRQKITDKIRLVLEEPERVLITRYKS